MIYKKLLAYVFLSLFLGCAKPDLYTSDNKKIFLDDLKGKWILINYWADWCPPCLKEMPELVNFAESNPDIEVFAYNFDRLEPEYLDPLILRFGVDIPSITSHPREIWGIESPLILPATYFIRPGGEIALSLLTPQTEESLQGHLDSLQEDS